jgi:multidrug efflux system outer membrane protein
MKLYKKYTGVAGLGIVLLSGCAIPGKVAKVPKPILPVAYNNSQAADTLSIAQLSYAEFFNDPMLVQVIDQVVQKNLDHKIALEQLKIAQAQLAMRRGAMLPNIQAVLSGSGTRYGKYTIEGVGNFDTNLSPNIEENQKVNTNITPNYWLGLSASWEIDIWGKLANLKRAAQLRFFATEQGRQVLQSALVTQAATWYYDLITLDQQQAILKENIALQESALEMVKVQKEVGRATELAVQQFTAQLTNSRAILFELQKQVINTENNLLRLMGEFDGKVERAQTIAPVQLKYRPDVKRAFSELEASHADAKAARAAFFPTVSLSGYGAFSAFSGAQVFNPASAAFQLLANMVAPIFQQNQLKSQFKIATTQQEIAFLSYQSIILEAFQEVKTLLAYINANESIVLLKQQEVEALDKSVDVSNELFVTGYANYLEIINAQRSKITADIDLIIANRSQAQTMLLLYKALGGGWQ